LSEISRVKVKKVQKAKRGKLHPFPFNT